MNSKINFLKFIAVTLAVLVVLLFITDTKEEVTAKALKPKPLMETENLPFKITTEPAIQEVVAEEVVAEEVTGRDIPKYNISLSQELQEHTWNQSNYMEIPYSLEISLLYAESRFDENAKNYNDTCRGIGQLSRRTGERLAGILQIDDFWNKNVFVAEYNINCSVYKLWELKQMGIQRNYSEEETILFMLGSYNMGVAGFDLYVSENGTMETPYSKEVLKYKNDLEQYGTIFD